MTPATRSGKRRVLVVEDEADIRDMLAYNLRQEGYDVASAETGSTALEEVTQFGPDLIILDLMLPDISGVEVCRRIRGGDRPQPAVIMLTAKAEEIDRVVGFEVGADDYVVKPFSVRELLLRVRARLQEASSRTGAPAGLPEATPGPRRFSVGTLSIDADSHRVSVEGREIPVSLLEMQLLLHLAQAQGTVCSRRDLLTRVWKYSPGVTSRTVDTHVKRLRDKLGGAGHLIRTIRGIGYRLSS
jgi:two-component system, OmpR family, phosphate regulon response regulator PhoB